MEEGVPYFCLFLKHIHEFLIFIIFSRDLSHQQLRPQHLEDLYWKICKNSLKPPPDVCEVSAKWRNRSVQCLRQKKTYFIHKNKPQFNMTTVQSKPNIERFLLIKRLFFPRSFYCHTYYTCIKYSSSGFILSEQNFKLKIVYKNIYST